MGGGVPASTGSGPRVVTRVIAGSQAQVNSYPWYLFLNTQVSPGKWESCGASLVTDRHVLTNAHCLGSVSQAADIGVYHHQ